VAGQRGRSVLWSVRLRRRDVGRAKLQVSMCRGQSGRSGPFNSLHIYPTLLQGCGAFRYSTSAEQLFCLGTGAMQGVGFLTNLPLTSSLWKNGGRCRSCRVP
jgi:hypothetical protein